MQNIKRTKYVPYTEYVYAALILMIIAAASCQSRSSTSVEVNASRSDTANSTAAEPRIEASPVSDGDGNYKLISGDSFRLTVHAPNASEVELFYQPVTADDRALRLSTLSTSANGAFNADMRVPEDFNGEVWGRVSYPSGEVKETSHLLLAKHIERKSQTTDANPSTSPKAGTDASDDERTSEDTDESARSDKLTGGKIVRGNLKPGDGNIRITVNVPAFTMTFWQGGKQIRTDYVGVGRKDFPIPIGMRSASEIIMNPDWIPPDSEWVRRSTNVEPYERIPADDPDNPLGKIKIPLGQAYLLHEAQSPSDIGNLVSHGCVRVLRDDLFELTRMIARARDVSITRNEIDQARKDSERRVLDLNGDIPVDINYDTMVVENGILTIYPDVYERDMNTIEKLRAELQQYDVDTSELDDATLRQMLDKVTSDEKFVVAIAEMKGGNAAAGTVEPLIPENGEGKGAES